MSLGPSTPLPFLSPHAQGPHISYSLDVRGPFISDSLGPGPEQLSKTFEIFSGNFQHSQLAVALIRDSIIFETRAQLMPSRPLDDRTISDFYVIFNLIHSHSYLQSHKNKA
jgi:hypothetical protein